MHIEREVWTNLYLRWCKSLFLATPSLFLATPLPIWVLHNMPFYRRSQGQNLASPYLKDFLYVLQTKCESKIWYGHLIEFSLQIKMRYHISVLLTPVCVVLNCLWLHYWPLHVNPPWDPSHQNLPFLSWAIIKLQLSSLDFNLNS